MRCLRLPFSFDVDRLRADLARVAPAEWIPHVQRRHYDGEWSGAALRSIGGVADNLVPDAQNIADFRDTALLERCDYFREVLGGFHCPLQAARLLRLHAGSSIAEHVDHALDFEDGEVRIHIPIVTSADVTFYLDGSRLAMGPGECWYTNVNLPHSVENRGTIDRVHLVVDCQVNDWLRDVFAAAPSPKQEHYAAQLELDSPPEIGSVISFFSQQVSPSVKFHAERRWLILNWAGPRSWQIRLRLPADNRVGQCWAARLESSPDPDSRHRSDYDTLLAKLAGSFPGIRFVAELPA